MQVVLKRRAGEKQTIGCPELAHNFRQLHVARTRHSRMRSNQVERHEEANQETEKTKIPQFNTYLNHAVLQCRMRRYIERRQPFITTDTLNRGYRRHKA